MNEIIKTENDNTLQAVQETQKLCEKLMLTPHYQKLGREGIFAIVQKAKSIGVDPLDALNGGMFFVQGKVELTSTLMNDLIRRKGHSITKDKNSDATVCILHGKRKDNGDTWCESFSIEDAKQAGIFRNQWLKYPKDMLFARALSRLARQLFPDVIKGCYVDGEIAQAVGIDREVEETVEMPKMSIAEMKDAIVNNIALENVEYLQDYLEFAQSKVTKPMEEVVRNWLDNPDPFKNHYNKWCLKKELENNSEIQYKEANQGNLFESHG